MRRSFFHGIRFFLIVGALLASTACSKSSVDKEIPKSIESTSKFGGQLAGGTLSDGYWKKIVAKTLPSISKVNSTWCDGTGTGSGFLVNGVFVTNRHVIRGASKVSLETTKGIQILAKSWGWSNKEDLAWIVPKEAFSLPSLKISTHKVIPGDLVVGVGFPLGGVKTVQRGRIFDLRSDEYFDSSQRKIIRTTNESLPGDSGGPLIDTQGHVIGVTFAIDLRKNYSLAISAESLALFLKDLPKSKKAIRCTGN